MFEPRSPRYITKKFTFSHIYCNGSRMKNKDVAILLNNLTEENDELKQQLKNKVIVNKQYEENCRLKADLKHERLVSKTLREVVKLQNKLLNEAEDLIESRLPDHYIKQYKNIKKGILDEGENI